MSDKFTPKTSVQLYVIGQGCRTQLRHGLSGTRGQIHAVHITFTNFVNYIDVSM